MTGKRSNTKRGAFFAGINRVMSAARVRWYRNAMLLNHGGGGGAGGGTETIELPNKISKAWLSHDPDERIPLAFEGIRTQLAIAVEAARTAGERATAIEKAAADMQKLTEAQSEILKEYRAALRDVPEQGETRGKIDLSGIGQWRNGVTKDDDLQKDEVALGISRMTRAQYNLTCRSVSDLGLDPRSVSAKSVERFQSLHDRLALTVAFLAKTRPQQLQEGWQKLPGASEYQALADRLNAAYYTSFANGMNETNATEGKNWVPSDILSARILPYIESLRRLSSLFEAVPMPGPKYTFGVQGSRLKPLKIVENVADDGTTAGAKVTPQTIITKKFNFDAVGYATGVVATPWWLEDAVVQAEFIVREIAESRERGLEDWILNGQLTAAIDNPAPASTDIRSCGDGIRYWFNSMRLAGLVTPQDLSAGMTGENIAKIFGNQGRYSHRARQSAFIVGNLGMTWCLLLKTQTGQNLVQTFNEVGGPGTVQTGLLAVMYGRPIVVTDEMSEGMDANGLVTAGGDRTAIIHVNTDAIKIGHRGGTAVEYTRDYRFFEHQDCFKAVWRSDIKHGYDITTEPTMNAGLGIRRL